MSEGVDGTAIPRGAVVTGITNNGKTRIPILDAIIASDKQDIAEGVRLKSLAECFPGSDTTPPNKAQIQAVVGTKVNN
jgi:hypothetical protein